MESRAAEGRSSQIGRTKKLIEVATWHFVGVKDESGELIAGAAYCKGCRDRSWKFGQSIGDSKFGRDGTCYENLSMPGPGGCKRPAPELLPVNRDVWDVFQRCKKGRGVVHASAFGFDGAPRGIRPEAAEKAAESAGIAWTPEVAARFEFLEDCWIAELDRQLAERKAQIDAELEAKKHG